MNFEEASTLLATVQTYDNRGANDGHILAWHDVLEPYTFADCRNAVRDYYRSESRWIMPADVANRVREVEAARQLKAVGNGGLSQRDEDEALAAGTYSAVFSRLLQLARHGVLSPEMYKNYLAKDLLLSEVVTTGLWELR